MALPFAAVRPAAPRDQRRAAVFQLSALAVLLVVAFGFFVHRYVILHDHPLFWDLRVYLGAIKAHALGLAPYRPGVLEMLGVDGDYKYTSTPLIDQAFDLASRIPVVLDWAEPVYIVVHIGAIVAIVAVLTTLFLGAGPGEALFGLALFLLMFKTAGMNTLAAANNGTILYGLLMLAAYRGFTKQRWGAFHVFVTLATTIKPIYAPLWLLPILADRFSVRQLVFATVGGVIALGSYLVYAVLEPALVQEWVANLRTQAIQTTNDLGENVFAAVYGTEAGHANALIPFLAQCAYAAALLLLFRLGAFTGRARWAALILVAVFVNPRLMAYDIAIASIPLVALAADALPLPGDRLIRALVVGCPLALVSIVLPYRTIDVVPAAILQPSLALAVLLLAAARPAWRPRPMSRAGAKDDLEGLQSAGPT